MARSRTRGFPAKTKVGDMTPKEADAFRAYNRQWHAHATPAQRAHARARRLANIRILQAWLLREKIRRGCRDCHEHDPVVLDWHHLAEKEMDISQAVHRWGQARMAREIAKCIVLCANCHRRQHVQVKSHVA